MSVDEIRVINLHIPIRQSNRLVRVTNVYEQEERINYDPTLYDKLSTAIIVAVELSIFHYT